MIIRDRPAMFPSWYVKVGYIIRGKADRDDICPKANPNSQASFVGLIETEHSGNTSSTQRDRFPWLFKKRRRNAETIEGEWS